MTRIGLPFLVAIATLAPLSAHAADRCGAFRVTTTARTRTADAALVTRLGRQKVVAANIGTVLSDGAWRLVWATPADAERGVFFFRADRRRGYRFVNSWGGVIPPDELASTIKWVGAHYGHPPEKLVACFVDAVIAE